MRLTLQKTGRGRYLGLHITGEFTSAERAKIDKGHLRNLTIYRTPTAHSRWLNALNGELSPFDHLILPILWFLGRSAPHITIGNLEAGHFLKFSNEWDRDRVYREIKQACDDLRGQLQ